jgi:predicted GIY-YIG superfamily endonuclease
LKCFVYEITIDGVRRYVGFTDNLNRRQKEHIRDYKKGSNKYLYSKTREVSPQTIYELKVIAEFDDKGDGKRYEALLILQDYFNEKNLWQSFPVGFKYF